MNNFNEMVVVAVTPFSGTSSTDKNGEYPVMLQLIAGKMPNRNVLSGTVAQRLGVEVGKSYLLQVRKAGEDKVFGDDFTFVKVKELMNGLEILQATKELGEARIINIERPIGFEDQYERKSIAVEGLKTQRIKEGLYKPALNTTVVDHDTAKDVIKGTSTENTKKSIKEEGLNQ